MHGVDQGSRWIFSLHESLKADQIAARSLASGVLTEDEVPEVVREVVSGWGKFYQDEGKPHAKGSYEDERSRAHHEAVQSGLEPARVHRAMKYTEICGRK